MICLKVQPISGRNNCLSLFDRPFNWFNRSFTFQLSIQLNFWEKIPSKLRFLKCSEWLLKLIKFKNIENVFFNCYLLSNFS